MSDLKAQTIATYDVAAKEYAKKFDRLGARRAEIEMVIEKRGVKNPHVLELGCGSGRDAAVITQFTDRYLGIDASAGLLEIAKANVPEARFAVADMETMEFPNNLDIIFALASLLHSPREAVRHVLEKSHAALNEGGLFYISLKKGEYREETIDNDYGPRTFYHYTPQYLKESAGDLFETVYTYEYEIGDKPWLEILLKKPSL